MLDKSQYQPGAKDRVVMNALGHDVESLVKFCQEQLQVHQPRGDYRQLLLASLLFLGEKLPEGVSLQEPGGTSDARWMAKAQYSLLIYLYRKPFPLQGVKAKNALRTLCVFIVKYYLRQWYSAPYAPQAPLDDLTFLQALLSNKNQSLRPLCQEAARKFQGHLWYLSEELAPLALFDSRVKVEEKRKFVEGIKNNPGSVDSPKRIPIDHKTLLKKSISDFATQNGVKFFYTLNLPQSFLEIDPEEWEAQDDFLRAREVVKRLRVVNDVAERGVALLQEYNKIITKDEEQRQFLLLSVQNYRKQFPNVNKETLRKMEEMI